VVSVAVSVAVPVAPVEMAQKKDSGFAELQQQVKDLAVKLD
jgi:hypothetical protein